MVKYTFFKVAFTSLVCYFLPADVFAQYKNSASVERAVTALIKAMTDSDIAQLSHITHKQLSYGHSNGKVQDKTAFLESFKNESTDFVSIEVTGQTIDMFRKTAVVRHTIHAVTNDNYKPGNVKLNIVTVWKKQNGQWKMITRQAVKPVS